MNVCVLCRQEMPANELDHTCPSKEIFREFDYGRKEIDQTTKPLLGTTVDIKQKYWPVFEKLIRSQFNHGGEKYKLEGFDDMESTDMICKLWETPGKAELKWLMKTCMKYMFRFMNFGREKDLLKIATYMFIAWLKMGFHLKQEHDEDTLKN